MKKLAVAVLLLCGCAGLVYGQEKMAPAATSAKGPSVSQALQQLERDWTDAEKAADVDKLNTILADDWVGLGYAGEKATKKSFLEAVKSGKTTLQSFEFGPMNVKVLGNVAVVQGSDTEKSTSNGEDSSGKYAWMDVFVKRNGNWVAVRSQTAKVK